MSYKDPKKFFKLCTRELGDGDTGTPRNEYVCNLENCRRGKKGHGLLARTSRETDHLKQHLKIHIQEGEMELFDGKYIVKSSETTNEKCEVYIYIYSI